MNHIYKSIFNKALGVFTAVPEFASAHGKGSERTVVGRVAKGTAGFAASALAISVGLALTSTSAVAGPGIYINDGVDEGCMALPDAPLPRSGIYGISSTGVSYHILTAGATAANAANLAYFGGNVMAPCLSTGNAAQEFSTQTNRTLFYGKNAPASVNDNGAKNLTLGGRLDVNSGIIGVGDRGVNGKNATNSIRMGTGTTLDEANKYKNAIAIGVDTATTAEGAVAISAEAKARTSYSIAIGRNATAGGDMVPPSNETGGAIAIGRNSLSNFIGAVALGNGATVSPAKSDGNTTDGIAIGTKALVDSYRGMAIGANSQAKGTQSIVLANNVPGAKVSTASGFRSQVYGVESEVSGSNSVAMGSTNTVASARTYAIGNNINAAAGTDDSLVFGTKAAVRGSNAIAIGSETQVNAYKGTAIGAFSEANGSQSLVIGNNVQGKPSVASGVRSQIIGVESNVVGEDATSIGYKNTILAARTYAMGNNINVRSGADDSVVMGSNNTLASVRTYAIGNNINLASNKTTDSLAFGTRAHVSDHDQISLGTDAGADAAATASNANSVAIGQSAGRYAQSGAANTAIGSRSGQYVKGSYNIAMGSNAGSGDATQVLEANNTVAIGNSAKASANNAMAIGIGSKAQAEQTVAFGPYATASGKFSTAIGLQARALGDNAIATGNHAAAVGTQQISIGINAGNSTGSNTSPAKAADYGVFIGRYAGSDAAGATGNAYGVGIGFEAGSYNQGGTNNFAIGSQAGQYVEGSRNASYGQHSGKYIKGSDNVAIGTRAGSGADGDILEAGDTIAIGRDSKASASYATAIGSEAKAKGIDSIAMGHNATASNANSVALGTNSATADVHTGAYTLNTSYTAAGKPVAENGTVSVGSAGKERQIQNVAAGVISETSTDAINGSQLYATNDYMNNFAGDVKTKLGGNAVLGNDGHLTMTNIGGTGKDNVNDAIAAAKTEVAAGDNITVTSTTNADGSKTYTVATKKDLVVDYVKAGDTTVNTDGVTIANGPSITKSGGINANGRKVTGVVNGDINSTSTDAVNGSQLHATNTKLDNVANALADTHFVVDTKATTGGELDGTSQADQKIKSGNKVTLQAGKNLKAKQTNSTDGAQVEFSLKDSISLTQVTAGTGANQVVLGNDGVQVGGNTYINKDGLNANSKPISNVADGVKPKDAVNKGQLDAVAQEAAKHTTVKAGKNVEVSEGTNAAGGKEYTVKTADNLNVTSVKAGDSTLNTDGLTITGGPSVKKDGINAGDKKITGVADGNVAAGSKDAVNGGQLAEVKAKADSAVQNVVSANPTALTVTKAGDTVTLTPNFIAGDLVNPATGEVNTPAADDAGKLVTAGTVAKALAETHFVVDTKATTGGELDGASQANQKIKSSNKVTLQAGKNLKAKQTNGTDGAQVEFSLKDSISLTQVTAGTGDNQVVLGKDGVQVGGNTYINKDGINAAGKAISNVANGNVAADSKDAVNGGQLHETAKSVADVIGGGATVKDGKVVAGQNGIGNTGQNTVHGAIAAINQNTANNFNQIRGDLRKMDRDLRGGIAGALATAGLPQAFRPGKSMVAAAASTYRGQSGLAIGVSRISDNGKVILKVTGNTNSRGDFGGTIGAGYQW